MSPLITSRPFKTSPAWDISGASYDSVSFNLTVGSGPNDIAFRPDGLKAYVLDATTNQVYQYSLSPAWDITSMSYDSLSLNVGNLGETSPRGLTFKPDGTKLYSTGPVADRLQEYTLSTPWLASSGTLTDNYLFTHGGVIAPDGIVFKPDGSKFFLADTTTDTIYEYAMAPSWDVSSASLTTSKGLTGSATRDVVVSSDGLTMFTLDSNDSRLISQYTMSSSWDLTTVSASPVSTFSVLTQAIRPYGFTFKDDGQKFYVLNDNADTVFQYST